MLNKTFIDAHQLAELVGFSTGSAYKVIRQLNRELADLGFITIPGKVPKKYFKKRWYDFTSDGSDFEV
ncbi:MAG TPA: ICEBs1 excisionase [Clostridiales bacterium]|nr:ICEBs1 excisionase [Clostridiales bacterium]